MEFISTTIGIKNSDEANVRELLTSLGFFNHIKEFTRIFGLHLELNDYAESYRMTNKFLKENNLEDEDPFYRVFDISEFGLELSIDIPMSFQYLDVVEPMVFQLGKHLSAIMQKEVIVLFKNGRIPIGLINNGVLTETFEEFNSEYMKNKSWKPVIE